MINKVDIGKNLQTNKRLLNLNMFIFAFETLMSCSLFTLAVLSEVLDSENDKVVDCRIKTALSFMYLLEWVALMARILMTSYMNIKFSRSLQQTNEQFLMIFNRNQDSVLQQYETNVQEENDRNVAIRKSKLYDQLANQQLSRIITSYWSDMSKKQDDEREVQNVLMSMSFNSSSQQEVDEDAQLIITMEQERKRLAMQFTGDSTTEHIDQTLTNENSNNRISVSINELAANDTVYSKRTSEDLNFTWRQRNTSLRDNFDSELRRSNSYSLKQ